MWQYEQGRKPSLSPTRLTTYLACPVKYRWTFLDSRGKWYLKAKSYYSFGTTLHRVLERFHREGRVGVPTTDEVLSAYDESWIDAGFSSAEEMAEAYGEGKVILERHFEQEQRRPITAKTLFVERQLKLDLGEFVLIGRLDRVDEHDDGTLEIIDYKSGRESIDVEDVRCDLAMSCYQVLLAHKYPDRKVRATMVALRSGEQASCSLDPSELVEFKEDIYVLGRRILDECFPELEPKPKGLCSSCDFVPLCRRHPEFEELARVTVASREV